MPVYEFQCQNCGLSFDKNLPYKKAKEQGFAVPCEGCETAVHRSMSRANFQFAQKASSALPQNTGIQSFDTNYDRVIGSDAEEKWKLIEKRQKEKVTLLRDNPTLTGSHIRRNLDNHYEVVSDEERNAFEFGKAVGSEAIHKGKRIR